MIPKPTFFTTLRCVLFAALAVFTVVQFERIADAEPISNQTGVVRIPIAALDTGKGNFFDSQWCYPVDGLEGEPSKGTLVFEKLEDWTQRPEPVIQHFTGTAVYRKSFSTGPTAAGQPLFLELGRVKAVAKVRLNGKDLGEVWCHPWRVEMTGAIKPGENTLEIEVVNLWPNRLVGDSKLSAKLRRTQTNFPVGSNQPLLSSGLLGPVRITKLPALTN